jgi:hypothetical protein
MLLFKQILHVSYKSIRQDVVFWARIFLNSVWHYFYFDDKLFWSIIKYNFKNITIYWIVMLEQLTWYYLKTLFNYKI